MKTVGHNFDESIGTARNPQHQNEDRLESRLREDALARSMVVRYARFDADARAFVAPFGVDTETVFASPELWGFEKMHGAHHWTGKGLFDLTGFPPAPPSRSKLTRPRFLVIFEEIQAEEAGGRIGADRGDPFRCVPQLRQLRIIGEARAAREGLEDVACFGLAVALGNCRVFGVGIGAAEDFTLSPGAAVAAARHAIAMVGAEVRAAETPVPGVTSALERLEARMDLWSASVAIEEAREAAASEEGADVA